MSPHAPILSVRSLCADRGGRPVLRNLDLDLVPGTITALQGVSGSGKTTLLRCLVRLDEPTAGAVLLDGEDIRTLDACDLRRRVAFVAQAPVMLPGTVRDNLAYGLGDGRSNGIPEALAAAGLPASFLERGADQLSGGEAARVAIARALVRSPRVLLLDEPTASLDEAAAAGIEALLNRLAAEDLAILVVTHDAAQATRIASRRAVLAEGRVAVAGP